MSWLFSRALVEEFSAGICSAGEPSAPSNGSHTQQAFLSHGKTTGFSRLSPFGMTCRPLTDSLGEAVLTSYLAAFPARTFALRGGAGIDGKRSSMWRQMARIVGEVRPEFVFVENSPLLVGRGLAVVLGDLAAMGYDAQWFCLSASDCGAPHQRDRIWILAHADSNRLEGVAIPAGCEPAQRGIKPWGQVTGAFVETGPGRGWWESEPDVVRVAHGVAARVDRLRAIGNGQVSRVAAAAFSMLRSGWRD